METTYMTMRDAVLAAKKGDSIEELEAGIIIKIGVGPVPDIPYKVAISPHWQVIKFDPKDLTAEEWGDYILELEQGTHTYKELATKNELPPIRLPSLVKRIAKDSFKKGDENGWNRTKELREALDGYIKDEDIQFHKSGIVEAMENLKPPQGRDESL